MSYVAFGKLTADDCAGAGGWWDIKAERCGTCPSGKIYVQGTLNECVPDPCPPGQRTNRVTYVCEPGARAGGGGGRGGASATDQIMHASSAPLIMALGGLMLAGYFLNKRPAGGAGSSEWR